MFERIMRTAAATLVAGTVASAISFAPPAKGYEPIQTHNGRQTQGTAKSDRMPLRLWGNACSQRPWPNFESNCQFDRREPGGQTRPVRIIALR